MFDRQDYINCPTAGKGSVMGGGIDQSIDCGGDGGEMMGDSS